MFRANILMVLPVLAFGQSAAPVRTFDVASVKPHEGLMPRIGVTIAGQRLTADAANLRVLVMYAYNLKNFQVADTRTPGNSKGDCHVR